MKNIDEQEKRLGQWHNSVQQLKHKAQAFMVLPGVPNGTSTLIELFLLNYFKESTDDMTYLDLVNLLNESIPGRNLFKNMLLAGAAWSCAGVETQSKGQITRKYLKKYQSSRGYVIDHNLLGFFTIKNTLYVSKLKKKENVATVMHELTHGLCNAIYQNKCLPYYQDDQMQFQNWKNYIDSIIDDLEDYMAALKINIRDNTATAEQICDYKLYNEIAGFKFNGYSEREYPVEAIAHLVQAVVYQDVDDFVKLSEKTKLLASQLLKRFAKDCHAWATASLQDVGFGLIEDPLVCGERGSEVERARAGDFMQSGLMYCSAAQAHVLNTALEYHKPIVDMWLDTLFQTILTDHWREGIEKYDMRQQYKDYYAWLEELTKSESQSVANKTPREDLLKERLCILWNQALEQKRVSLNGLFEAIVRYLNRLPEEKCENHFIQSCFKVYFDLVDIHAKDEPKHFGQLRRLTDNKFDFTRMIIFISKHYSPRYYQLFFDLMVAHYSHGANVMDESVIYWLGASGHPAIMNEVARMPKIRIEKTLSKVVHGAICYGKTQLVELLAQRYPVELTQILKSKLAKWAAKSKLAKWAADIIHYGYVGIVEVLCKEIPALRQNLIPIYLCIADKKSLSFSKILGRIDIDFMTVESTDELISMLCQRGFYKELAQLIDFIVINKPECLNLKYVPKNEPKKWHHIQQFIAKGDLKAFEIMTKYEPERMCKDNSDSNILHVMVTCNRYEFAVNLKNNHPRTFERLVTEKDSVNRTPFDYAMHIGDFRLAALFSLERLIRAVNENIIPTVALSRNRSKSGMLACVLAAAGPDYEGSLITFLSNHPEADLTLKYEAGNTLLHFSALYNLPAVAQRILDLFPNASEIENLLGETPIFLAIKNGFDQVAELLYQGALLRLDQNQLQSLLCDAVVYDCFPVFEHIISLHNYLLFRPVCESYLDIHQPTIAMLATMCKSHKVLTWVKHRLNQTENFSDFNPLILLTLNNDSKNLEETLQQILDQGGQALFSPDRSGRNPMHFAACASLEICQAFYRYNPNFDDQDDNGNSPLHIALMISKTDIAKFLIETCHVKQAYNNAGLRPVHLAAAKGSYAIKSLLEAFPEEINVLTRDANTVKSPLVIAITNGKEKAAMYLVNHGADLSNPNYLIELATSHAMHALAKAILNKSMSSSLPESRLVLRKVL